MHHPELDASCTGAAEFAQFPADDTAEAGILELHVQLQRFDRLHQSERTLGIEGRLTLTPSGAVDRTGQISVLPDPLSDRRVERAKTEPLSVPLLGRPDVGRTAEDQRIQPPGCRHGRSPLLIRRAGEQAGQLQLAGCWPDGQTGRAQRGGIVGDDTVRNSPRDIADQQIAVGDFDAEPQFDHAPKSMLQTQRSCPSIW
jgi:hypothetical protein